MNYGRTSISTRTIGPKITSYQQFRIFRSQFVEFITYSTATQLTQILQLKSE